MIWEYEYTKQVNPSILDDMIKFDATLRPKYLRVGTADDDIICYFSEALTPSEHDLLNVVVDEYSETHPWVIRHGLKGTHIEPAMKFGMEFLAEFNANNIQRGKTADQITALLTTYSSLVICCLTGSLNTLYAIVFSMVADANISQGEIDEFKLRLEIYLGIA